MLVQVEYQTVQKWVRVPVTDDCYDYLKFMQEVHAKFNLASDICVDLKDSSGVDVDADIFDELLRSATVSFKVVTKHFGGVVDESEVTDASFSSEDGSASSVESPSSSSSSTVITENTRAQRRRLAEGPPDSKMAKDLFGDGCKEAMSIMKHASDQDIVKEKMKATFKHRQNMLHDLDQSSLILDHFPRFLDTPGLDFIMLFGEDISGKFIARWPTFYKPKVITVSKSLRQSVHLDDLLSAQEESSDYEWDSDVAAILLLVHLLPPTAKGRKHVKISATEAADRVVKFMKVGTSMATFLGKVGSAQLFLLCVGEKKSSIQKFYIILDQKPIPCVAQTAVAAFDELFKAHFVFAMSYDAALLNFYTFIQTTVYGIDVTTKESPRVKEIRVRINNT
ncbi:uncharacterized protein LOC106960717 isoform X2 [Poecilia latipinna]|uniref:uncharacterized protein LOC106960717 isoform X2 n=1 Tax=Poecilia latipinna TaxID=48699 RepID=UPI00072EDC45|nr:PREDICTED: uncharacterized protein LOC106960717 isoform X2 [Poecilia latipinna]